MEFDASRLSDMQRAMIRPDHLEAGRYDPFNRELSDVNRVLDVACGGNGSFSRVVKRMIKECPVGETFVVLDGGGGSGGVVADILGNHYVSQFRSKAKKCMRGIALDLNPLPELIEDRWDEEDRMCYDIPEVEYVQGDVRSLSQFDDESVNLYILYEVAHYIDDLLAVLQEGYRVLKDDGLMFMNFDTRMATDPALQDILKEVDPEGRIFTVKTDGYGGYAMVLSCRKVLGVELKFPYKFKGSRRRDFKPRELSWFGPMADISIVGEYESLS